MPPTAVEFDKDIRHASWFRSLSKYEKPDYGKAIGQILNTVLPYFALWFLMVSMLQSGVSYWLVLPLAIVAAGLLVRIFIIFHDCCHGSFFGSRIANRALGFLLGIIVFTPFEDWRRNHAGHHASSGDLDRRGTGDIWTLTVEEYRSASRLERITYRIFRSAPFLFFLAPICMFLILHRFPHKVDGRRERLSVHTTTLSLVALVTLLCATIGWRIYVMVQLPILIVAFAAGVWLFYIQHQFEHDYWEHHHNWDPMMAALKGSSYYKLPKVLQWFSGNIGLHHIHHLRPGIPNYNLQRCQDETPELQAVKPLTLLGSFRSLFLHLWDETDRKLVGFRALRSDRIMHTSKSAQSSR